MQPEFVGLLCGLDGVGWRVGVRVRAGVKVPDAERRRLLPGTIVLAGGGLPDRDSVLQSHDAQWWSLGDVHGELQ